VDNAGHPSSPPARLPLRGGRTRAGRVRHAQNQGGRTSPGGGGPRGGGRSHSRQRLRRRPGRRGCRGGRWGGLVRRAWRAGVSGPARGDRRGRVAEDGGCGDVTAVAANGGSPSTASHRTAPRDQRSAGGPPGSPLDLLGGDPR
jgi:hypothetical protein